MTFISWFISACSSLCCHCNCLLSLLEIALPWRKLVVFFHYQGRETRLSERESHCLHWFFVLFGPKQRLITTASVAFQQSVKQHNRQLSRFGLSWPVCCSVHWLCLASLQQLYYNRVLCNKTSPYSVQCFYLLCGSICSSSLWVLWLFTPITIPFYIWCVYLIGSYRSPGNVSAEQLTKGRGWNPW